MTYIFRPSHYNVTDSATARVYEPGGAAAAKWWLGPWSGFPLAAAIAPANCIAAYRAINTPGSVWGAGPTVYAESLINLANPGTYDLVEGNGPVAWGLLTGWEFLAAQAKYLNTLVLPAAGWSMFIRFAGVTGGSGAIGQNSLGNNRFYIFPNYINNIAYGYGASFSQVAPQLATGNIGLGGAQGYRNGIADGGALGAWGGVAVKTIIIGAINNEAGGVPTNYMTGNVLAACLYNILLDVNQTAALGTALTGAMAAL